MIKNFSESSNSTNPTVARFKIALSTWRRNFDHHATSQAKKLYFAMSGESYMGKIQMSGVSTGEDLCSLGRWKC